MPNLLAPGTPVARIETTDGRFLRIESPCDCVHGEWLLRPGQFADQGEEVALLVAVDQPLLVQAQVAVEKARRFSKGDVALIEVPGRDGQMRGQIESIDFTPTTNRIDRAPGLEPDGRSAIVIIRPDQPFEFEDLGSMVDVEFPKRWLGA